MWIYNLSGKSDIVVQHIVASSQSVPEIQDEVRGVNDHNLRYWRLYIFYSGRADLYRISYQLGVLLLSHWSFLSLAGCSSVLLSEKLRNTKYVLRARACAYTYIHI